VTAHGDRRLGRRWPAIVAWAVALAAVAAFLVALLERGSTTLVRTVIVPMPAASVPVTQDSSAGALSDAEAFWAQTDATPGRLQTWTLAYKIESYTPATAILDSWGLATGGGVAGWRRVHVTVHYRNGRWQPVGVTDFAMVADSALNPASSQFDATISSFNRFPGAP
jgi:hypothetical protein